jgi:cytochrome c5
MKSILFVALVTAVFWSCTATKSTAPSQADVETVSARFPGYSLVQLQEGKLLYESHCGTCHDLKDPKSKDESGWYRIVPVMSARVNGKTPGALNEDKEQLIVRYLITMSERK